MLLDEFINEVFSNLMTIDGINNMKQIIKEDMFTCGYEYKNTKVENQVFDKDNNYDPRVEITSEGYDDGEIIFIDYHLD